MNELSITLPTVTVIVPVYNSRKLLNNCVRSILRQTYTNLQVVLVDDGSTDGSGELCDQFAKYDFRVEVIHQPNSGIGAAQNAGLDVAKGEFIAFSDNDDLMHPQMIERLYEILIRNQADMSRCGWHNIGESKALEKYEQDAVATLPEAKVVVFESVGQAYQTVFSKVGRILKKNAEYMYFHEGNWAKLYDAKIFSQLRFPENGYAQDVYINTELHLNVRKCASVTQKLYYWLQHPQSVTHTSRKFKFHADIMDAAFHNIDVSNEFGIFPKRSYFHMKTTIKLLKMTATTVEEFELVKQYKAKYRQYLKKLKLTERIKSQNAVIGRTIETIIYSLTIDKRK
jgi:glycosyltransferase involved in cell wall biosynthesis